MCINFLYSSVLVATKSVNYTIFVTASNEVLFSLCITQKGKTQFGVRIVALSFVFSLNNRTCDVWKDKADVWSLTFFFSSWLIICERKMETDGNIEPVNTTVRSNWSFNIKNVEWTIKFEHIYHSINEPLWLFPKLKNVLKVHNFGTLVNI